MKYRFIVFEGIDGCGKSTQARMLADFFVKNNIPFILTQEPSDSKYGKKIRQLLSQENPDPDKLLEYFVSDRKWHVDNVIRPSLSKGFVVVCDRYYHSTFAYQSIHHGIGKILSLHKDILTPDIVIIFDIPPEMALKRTNTNEYFEKLDFLKKVYRNYKDLKVILKGENIVYLDIKEKSVEEVFKEVLSVLGLK